MVRRTKGVPQFKRLSLSRFHPGLELAKFVDQIPSDQSWLHETKYDGYRILSYLKNKKVQLRSRNGLNWTHRFNEIALEIENIPVESAVFDGEVVVIDRKGLSNFSALQNRLSEKQGKGFIYFVFDLLYLNGFDLRDAPLLARKNLLKVLLQSRHKSPVRFAAHQIGRGEKIYQFACHHGFEGVISKHIQSTYRAGRSSEWVKTKCRHEEEFVIGGFSDPGGSRTGFGALLLGYWKSRKFIYCGRVGTGFNTETLNTILKALKKIETEKSQFSNELTRDEARGVHYVRPEYVAQVQYTEWTADQRLRQPVFLGLREDKSGSEVNRAA